ncbi:MAG: hypothetical protein HY606_08060 [Planctomycetes bacterium]|nr:hypothetical protein [Planctomycetota bacterium]
MKKSVIFVTILLALFGIFMIKSLQNDQKDEKKDTARVDQPYVAADSVSSKETNNEAKEDLTAGDSSDSMGLDEKELVDHTIRVRGTVLDFDGKLFVPTFTPASGSGRLVSVNANVTCADNLTGLFMYKGPSGIVDKSGMFEIKLKYRRVISREDKLLLRWCYNDLFILKKDNRQYSSELSCSKVISIKPEKENEETIVNVTLEPPPTATVQFRLASNELQIQNNVLLNIFDNSSASSVMDLNSVFHINVIEGREYRLPANIGLTLYSTDFVNRHWSTNLRLDPNEAKEIVIEFEPLKSNFTGKCINEDGTPASGKFVCVGQEGGRYQSFQTGEDGTFKLSLKGDRILSLSVTEGYGRPYLVYLEKKDLTRSDIELIKIRRSAGSFSVKIEIPDKFVENANDIKMIISSDKLDGNNECRLSNERLVFQDNTGDYSKYIVKSDDPRSIENVISLCGGLHVFSVYYLNLKTLKWEQCHSESIDISESTPKEIAIKVK